MRTVVGGVTVSDAEVELLRFCASLIVMGSDFAPTPVVNDTVAVNENVPLWLSANDCVADPPIDERSPVTTTPVLAGFVPAVTVTVIAVVAPGRSEFGLADAVPLGGVDCCVTASAIDAAAPWP